MTPSDLQGYADRAQAAIDLGFALTTIPPEHLRAIVVQALAVDLRERVDLQSRTIAEQAREIERLKAALAGFDERARADRVASLAIQREAEAVSARRSP